MIVTVFLINLICFVVGINVPQLNDAVTISDVKQFPLLNSLNRLPVFSQYRRRQANSTNSSCDLDTRVFCISAEGSCNLVEDIYTKWTVQYNGHTEYFCYPSRCSASNIREIYRDALQFFNDSASYCTMECPEITFNISASSDDNREWRIDEKYRYMNFNYYCAGAVVATDMSRCLHDRRCPVGDKTVQSCSLNMETSNSDVTGSWDVCFPNECTGEANIEKMEDFEYAGLVQHFLGEGTNFNREEARNLFMMDYVCSKSSSDSNNMVIYVVIPLISLVFCLGAILVYHYRCRKVDSKTDLTSTQDFQQDGL